MKRYRLNQLPDVREGHFLKEIIGGEFLSMGGLGFKPPGFRTHTQDGPGGSDLHVHDGPEVFVILQGRAVMEMAGKKVSLVTGDVLVVECGEDHHLVADAADPCVNLWLHAGDERHPDQAGRSG